MGREKFVKWPCWRVWSLLKREGAIKVRSQMFFNAAPEKVGVWKTHHAVRCGTSQHVHWPPRSPTQLGQQIIYSVCAPFQPSSHLSGSISSGCLIYSPSHIRLPVHDCNNPRIRCSLERHTSHRTPHSRGHPNLSHPSHLIIALIAPASKILSKSPNASNQ